MKYAEIDIERFIRVPVMERREVGIGSSPAQPSTVGAVPVHLRFRTEAEPGGDPMRRRWQAVYSYGEGWARFHIVVNLSRGTLTLHRSLEADYMPMLRQLIGKHNSMTLLRLPKQKVESMTFDIEILGYKMSRMNTGEFQSGPSGDWLVVQAFVPGSAESFLIGVNDRLNAGEIVIRREESTPVVFRVLSQVFG